MNWGHRDFMAPGRSLAVGDRGMAATSHPAATLAAIDILRAGGNAIDAAIAAVALQGVVDPHMTGIGGDCFAIYAPASGRPVAINGSGRAPARAELSWFLEQGLTAIPDDSAHAVTVPGAVDAWCRLAADYGSKGLEEVLAPAIQAAEDGFLVTPRAAHDWGRYGSRIERHGTGMPVYMPGSQAPRAGDRLSHPALGVTLRRIATHGRSGFYEGEVADELVSLLRSMGSLIDNDDFLRARPDYVEPIGARYRGYTLLECPPNGQGIAALLIARILDGFDLSDSSLSEADRIHLLAEATKAAYGQRDAIVGDPAYSPVDVEELLSESSVSAMRKRISRDRALPALADIPMHRDTVHVAVVDRDGNAISFINSLFFAFGSGIYAPRSGVLLHNRGAGFRLTEGHPNAIGAQKRPLHTIIPALLEREGRPVMPFGVMGGQYQAVGHVQLLTGLIDRGLDIQQACDAPRTFASEGVLSLETTIGVGVADDLAARGHSVIRADEPLGASNAIYIDYTRGVMFGASDHRKDGVALGL